MKKIAMYFKFAIIYMLVIICIDIFVICKKNVSDRNGRVSVVYLMDKKDIASMFIENVEAFRLAILQMERNPISSVIADTSWWDPAPFFSPYAIIYDEDKKRSVALDVPVSSRLKAYTDTIFYNKDSLLAVAIVTLEMKRYIGDTDKKNILRYDARALFCCRGSVSEKFSIYPFTLWNVIGYNNKELATKDMIYLCTHKVKGIGMSADTVCEGGLYLGNVDEPSFFDSIIFNKSYDGLYLFQYYVYMGEVGLYNYHSNIRAK